MQDPEATLVRPPSAAPVLRTDPDATRRRPEPAADPDATVLRPVDAAAALPGPRLSALALPAGARLFEYRIDGVLGQGGFGITYLATDVNLRARVAIKEYLPEDIAFRAGDRSVSPNASRHRDRYRRGLESFLVEARTLASFRHPAIVRVARFFEAHRTAYMVLEYEKGQSLREWWPAHRGVGERGLVELLAPLLDGLEAVHAAGFLHRDIKPNNIQVRADDGRLVLLDFGSAAATVALAEDSAVVVTPGFAPIEQYGLGEQGPWTDVYALGATLYWALSGHKPDDAEDRAAGRSRMPSAAQAGAGRFGAAFLAAIDRALEPDARLRPRSVAEFRQALFADHLGSIGLQEALRGDDRQLEGAAGGLRRGGWAPAAARARSALHILVSPPRWPLALKMTLALLATALLPMGLTAAYNLQVALDALSAAELRFVEQLAHSTAGRIAQFVSDSKHLTRALATDGDFAAFLARPTEADKPALRNKLERLAQANPDVQLLMLMDPAGTAVVSSDVALIGRNFAFRQYFQQALQGRPFATGLLVGAGAGAAGMFYAEPVFAPADPGAGPTAGAGSNVLGVLVLRIRGASVGAILDEVRHDSTLTPFLVDGDGVLVHHPREDLLYRSLVPLPAATLQAIQADQRFRRDRIDSLGETALAQALVGARRIGHVSYFSAVTKREEIAGFAPVAGNDWVVGVSESRARFEAPLSQLALALAVCVALVGLLFTGLALRFARNLVQPLRALTQAADALKAGDFDAAAVKVVRRDELGQLARTFNVMVDVLRQRERERGAAASPAGPARPPRAGD